MRDWLINLPSELTEADLVDMVEGTLPAHREPVAIAALKAEPRLGLLIKQMRADRDGAAGLAQPERAPADVGERVLGVIDRRVIRELDEAAQQQAQHIPVSTLTIHEPSALELFMQSAWTKRLAVAAGVLIAAGVGFLGYRIATQKPDDGPMLAERGTPSRASRAATPDKVADAPVAAADSKGGTPGASDALLNGESAPDMSLAGVESGPRDAVPSADAAATQNPATASAAATETIAVPKSSGIALAVAARLAREGRLAIVVYGPSAEAIAARAQSLAKAGPVAGAVVCRTLPEDKVPSQALALLTPDVSTPSSPGATPTSVAGDQPSGPDMSLSSIAPETAPVAPTRTPAPTFMATLDASERTLSAIKAHLEGVSDDGNAAASRRAFAEFRMMDRAIDQAISLDPESILWWNTPSSRWARMAGVPILIEAEGK